jgi:hypothetical protein
MADIGIEPGPFSFLAEFGRAGGAAFQAASQEQDRQLKQAQDKARYFLDLRAAGLMKPEQFNDPAVQQLFERAYGKGSAPMATPTPAESLSDLKGQYASALNAPPTNINIPLQSLGGFNAPVSIPATAKFTPEQRAAVGAPQQSALQQEQVAQKTGAVQLSEATPTEQSKTQLEQDKQFNDIADAVVQTLFNRNGKLPTAKDAAQYGIHDPRASLFGSRINETHYGAAIERMRRQLEAEKTNRIRATQSGSGGQAVDYKLLGQLNSTWKGLDDRIADIMKDPLVSIQSGIPGAEQTNPKVRELMNIKAQRDAAFTAAGKYAAGLMTPDEARQAINAAVTTKI